MSEDRKPNERSEQTVPRVAVVTGGGSGIGLATTVRLVGQGWSVLVADLDPDRAGRALAEAGLPGERVAWVGADVSQEADVEAAVAAAVDRFGGLGAMVNNAGLPARSARSSRPRWRTGTSPSPCWSGECSSAPSTRCVRSTRPVTAAR